MSALTLAPRRWYSWDFSVAAGDKRLAEFNLSSWREKGVVRVEDWPLPLKLFAMADHLHWKRDAS